MAMEQVTGQFPVLNAWNQPAEYSIQASLDLHYYLTLLLKIICLYSSTSIVVKRKRKKIVPHVLTAKDKLRFLNKYSQIFGQPTQPFLGPFLCLLTHNKAKLLLEATFFIINFTYLKQICRSKMAMEPQQAIPIPKMDGTRLPSTPWPFWTCISTSGK